jgi:UDP-N-acetyl-D-glucosamine dehydrogenase
MKVESTHEPQTVLGDAASSVAPDGSVYLVPSADEARSSFESIAESAREHRSRGGRVVVVQGLGFVGSAAAAVIADATDQAGRYPYFVIGVDLATPASYWKVAKVAAGTPPVASADPKLAHLTASAVHDVGNLWATTCEDAYSLADLILVDVQLDALRAEGDDREIGVEMEPFVAAIRAIGKRMRPEALVLVETTVPVGTCERVVLPVLREERLARGVEEPVLLAHAYERVMPGPRYVESIRAYPRTFAGVDERSSRAAREFLSSIIRTPDGDGLRELDTPASSELAKLLENSYRATNIAFIHEWTLLAEDIGVNLFEVVDSIRVRKGTHDNMRYPGFGVGGYCLTKDSLLAQWGATQLLGSEATLEMTIGALATNEAMPLHTARLVREALGEATAGAEIAIGGVSYIPEVADTRNSPTETLVSDLLASGTRVRVHDPIVRTWIERPDIPIVADLAAALAGADGVVFAVPHPAYQALTATTLTRDVGRTGFLVDAQNVVSDETARELHAAGWRIFGVGKGHWRAEGLHR